MTLVDVGWSLSVSGAVTRPQLGKTKPAMSADGFVWADQHRPCVTDVGERTGQGRAPGDQVEEGLTDLADAVGRDGRGAANRSPVVGQAGHVEFDEHLGQPAGVGLVQARGHG